MRPFSRLSLLASAFLSCLLGCAVPTSLPIKAPHAEGTSGQVKGGQQPVTGATIQLYAVGTAADGSASTPLLTQPVTTDANGNFTITNLYNCTGASLVYITATGGNPGLAAGSKNPNLALMSVLGPCSSLTQSTFVSINEQTTVAAASALAPFLSSSAAIGSGPSDTSALTSAFSLAAEYVNPATGALPGLNVPSGYTVPNTLIVTLADIIASCINSPGGTAGDSSSCGQLFTLTQPANTAPPTDTIAALRNIAQFPAANLPALLALLPANPPFQSALSSPPPSLAVALIPNTPALIVSPAQGLQFSYVQVNGSSASQSFSLVNTSSALISLSSIALSGPNAADFRLNSSCSSQLSPQASCNVALTFSPSAAGGRSAFLTVNSSASQPIQTFPVYGFGVTAAPSTTATLSTNALSMQDFNPGTVNVVNSSANPLTLYAITTTAGFTQTNNCPATLAANSVCTIIVTPPLTPYNVVPGVLTVTDNASPFIQQTASLTSLLDPVIEFGSASLGSSSPLLAYATSDSSGGLNGTFSGPHAADFFFTPAGGCFVRGQTCSIAYGFKPTALGQRVAVVVLTPNTSPGATYVLSGTGVPVGPSLSFVTQNQNLNTGISTSFTIHTILTVPEYSTSSFYGYLYNGGTTPIALSPITFTGNAAGDFSKPSTCTTIAAGASCFVSFTFIPQGFGTRAANLVTTDSNSGQTFTLPFAVTATAPLPQTSTSSLLFAPTHLGLTAQQTFTISTAGQSAGDAVSISSSGSNTLTFTPNVCSTSPSPCTVTVTYTPKAASSPGNTGNTATDTATLTIKDTTQNVLSTVALAGTPGVAALTLSASQLNFGTQTVGTASTPQTVTLYNTGDGYLVVDYSRTNITNSSSSTPDFTAPFNGQAYNPVAPGASFTLPGIIFNPVATGARNGTLNVNTNLPTATVALTGTGK